MTEREQGPLIETGRMSYRGSISGVKVSVSLPTEDVHFLDAYAREHGIDSRSGVLHRAVALLRASELSEAYVAAWAEWADSGDAQAWEVVVSDGMGGR